LNSLRLTKCCGIFQSEPDHNVSAHWHHGASAGDAGERLLLFGVQGRGLGGRPVELRLGFSGDAG
jgi:hypothetical protein